MSAIKCIGLVGRPEHSGVVSTLVGLVELLQKKKLGVVLDKATAKLLPECGLPEVERNQLADHCNLLIVVGGDGSMLSVARAVASQQLPVIGVNRGRLGFLTDINPDDLLERIEQILRGEYTMDSRFLLDISLLPNGERSDAPAQLLGSALNDVVLHPGQAAQMIEFELFIDGQFVYSQGSDGLIVATPTGSTAYSLSAGGPIMYPSLNAIVLVPMYPHSLNSRPIVVDGDSEIRIVVSRRNRLYPQLSCDGGAGYTVKPGDQLLVKKKQVRLQLLHPLDHSFYEACRSKLGWGSRLVKQEENDA
ncbi:MAG: NAD kinase [Pseudohongiella sp.]|nr:MAG: NAD kinase [Pseudohongiella sp.]